MKLRNSRLTPAMVVAIIALVVAAGGTSLAKAPVAFVAKALGLNSTQKKQVTKIADTQIRKKAKNLSVKSANTATTASSAINALSAVNASALGGQAASAFFPADRVFSSGVKAIANTGTVTTTPTTVLTVGPFTVQASCTLSGGVIALDVAFAYPAKTILDETYKTAAGTETLDTNASSLMTFAAQSTTLGDWTDVPLTVIAPDDTPYQFLEGWDAVNAPIAGDCAVQLLAIQG
jgi:hypothetical protein